MKCKVKSMLPPISNIQSFREFEQLCNSSNLELDLDNTPIPDDNIVEVAKEVWEEHTTHISHDNAIITFQEYTTTS